MKTLDEVIKALEMCTADDAIESEGVYLATDALHYLKEFQSLSKMWNDKLDKEQANPPLTWDELQKMEGKPVWVEEKGMLSIWIIIGDVSKNWLYPTDCNAYRHEDYGKSWQAYRKERK